MRYMSELMSAAAARGLNGKLDETENNTADIIALARRLSSIETELASALLKIGAIETEIEELKNSDEESTDEEG